jgi:SH3-like domain-containing protein
MRLAPAALLAFFAALPHAAAAADFRSTTEAATITYDAPSTRARKLGLLGRDYPVEVIVNLEAWIKIRDATGALSWVEKKVLSDKRTVVVRSPVADVLASTDPNAPVAFKAEQGVLLELVDPTPVNGLVSVRHRDGQAGFVRVAQVWGL